MAGAVRQGPPRRRTALPETGTVSHGRHLRAPLTAALGRAAPRRAIVHIGYPPAVRRHRRPRPRARRASLGPHRLTGGSQWGRAAGLSARPLPPQHRPRRAGPTLASSRAGCLGTAAAVPRTGYSHAAPRISPVARVRTRRSPGLVQPQAEGAGELRGVTAGPPGNSPDSGLIPLLLARESRPCWFFGTAQLTKGNSTD